MNILVTGAGGQLGTELRLLTTGDENSLAGHRCFFSDIIAGGEDDGKSWSRTTALDITDSCAVEAFLTENEVDLIVNCAAYTNVDKAEDDKVAADRVNHIGPAVLASAAAKQGAGLIHISTDYVFDGNSCIPYKETHETAPTSIYGITKLAGEQAVTASGCKYIIIRTAWLYSAHGKNFVKTIAALTSQKESIKVVFDQVGTPTNAADLAAFIRHIIVTSQTDKTGIYHFTNEGVCSWYDFAVEINRLCGNGCRVMPCYSEEFWSKVPRPHYSVLDKTNTKLTFNVEIPHWRDSLENHLKNL